MCVCVFRPSYSKNALQKLTLVSVDGFVSNLDSVFFPMHKFPKYAVCESTIWTIIEAGYCLSGFCKGLCVIEIQKRQKRENLKLSDV